MKSRVERFSTEPPSPKALVAPRVKLPASAPDVIARYVSRQRREFLRCGKAIRQDGGIDALHDLRVASRRLRAALALVPEESASKAQNKVRKSLRRLGRVLGGPRESDVNVALLEKRESEAEPSAKLALEVLLGFEQERQQRRRAKMRQNLKKIDLEEIGRRLSPPPGRRGEGRWLLPLDRFAAQHVDVALRELEKLWERASERPSEQNLHALRIAIKKLRYMLEILSPALVPRRRSASLSRLRSLQDVLGNLHDLSVLHREVVERRRFLDGLSLTTLSATLSPVQTSLFREIRSGRLTAVARLRGTRERGFLEGLSSGLLHTIFKPVRLNSRPGGNVE